MRILYVWDADYPWDVRTEKVCLALAEHGHQVVIAARNLQARPPREKRPEGIVERLPRFWAWGRRALSFPAPVNPFWFHHVRRLSREHDVDLIVVRDLPLAPTSLMASGGRRPVIMDMAENYPAMIADIWTDGRQGTLDAVVRNPRLVAAVERWAVRRMAHILTVVEESRDRVINLGVPADRVSVVSNTPPTSRMAALPPRLPTDPLAIVYLGLMEHHRGVGVVLEAAQLLANAGVSFRLDLVGDGRDYDEFRTYGARLGLSGDRVVFHGRLSHTEAIAVVGRAHVGIVPHHARESWNTTIPNKLFDYMAAGLAVVSSDAVPAARVVNQTGAGLVFRSGDQHQLAEKLRVLLDLPRWEQYRRAGQEAIRSRYNWETDRQVLLEVVSRFRPAPDGGEGFA
jgi:glycosyltransferase involved in cell wall biosynthesis